MKPIVVDSGAAKRELALRMGATAFVDFTETNDVQAKVREIADGIGAHGVLVTAYQAYKGISILLQRALDCNSALLLVSDLSR